MGLWGNESLGEINQGLIGSGTKVEDAAGAMSDAHENLTGPVAQANAARESVDQAMSALLAASDTFGKGAKKMNTSRGMLAGAAAKVEHENEKLNHSGLRDVSLTLRNEGKNVNGQMDAAKVLQDNSKEIVDLLVTVSKALGELINTGSALDKATESSAQNQATAGTNLTQGLPTS